MITRVAGIRVGHVTDLAGITGCTVVLCPPGTTGSVDVKGGAPGTRETDAIRPGTSVNEIHAVLLTGGSAFGLAAAGGVVRWLEERGVGFDAGVARVPIVPAAVLFDLAIGEPTARPDEAAGYAACEAAADGDVEEGSVGAGTGATVAKHPDPAACWKGGVGGASVEVGRGRGLGARRGQRARSRGRGGRRADRREPQPGRRAAVVAGRQHDPGGRRDERDAVQGARAAARAGRERGARRSP